MVSLQYVFSSGWPGYRNLKHSCLSLSPFQMFDRLSFQISFGVKTHTDKVSLQYVFSSGWIKGAGKDILVSHCHLIMCFILCPFKFPLVLNPILIRFLSSIYSQLVGQIKGAGKNIFVSHCHLIMCLISCLFKFPLVLNPTRIRFLSSMYSQVVDQIKGASKNFLVSHCHLIAYL